MKRRISLLGWLVLTWAAHANNVPYMPIYPMGNSFAPFVDTNGYVNPIINLGNIDFGQSLTLPLVLNFSSAIRSPSPEFGQGWECPLFEAKVVDVQKDEKKVELLGGKTIFLMYNPRTDSWNHYYSDHWVGQVKGDDFQLAYDGVWTFLFHKGLISSMTTPGGRTVLWNRTGEKLMSMNEVGKSPAMEIHYDDLGFAKQIVLNPDSLGVSKYTYDFTADLISAGISKIHSFKGRQIVINRSFDKSLNPVLELTDTKGLGGKLTWDKTTGKILSDGDFAYQITEMSPDGTYPRMSRKSYLTGQSESFYFDPNHGTTDITSFDGTVEHIEMVVAPGPNYKEIRLDQRTKNGKTQDILRRAFDDQGHLLQEAVGLPNGQQVLKQYTYDTAGRVVSYLLNGKEVWKNVYDPITGQLKERYLPNLGVKLAFDSLPGGDVKESIEKASGVVTSTQILNSSDWQAKTTSYEGIH